MHCRLHDHDHDDDHNHNDDQYDDHDAPLRHVHVRERIRGRRVAGVELHGVVRVQLHDQRPRRDHGPVSPWRHDLAMQLRNDDDHNHNDQHDHVSS